VAGFDTASLGTAPFRVCLISPCVGGLVRLWVVDADGTESSGIRAVEDPEHLPSFQACGALSRTGWGAEGWGSGLTTWGSWFRFREIASVAETGDKLIVAGRYRQAAGRPADEQSPVVHMTVYADTEGPRPLRPGEVVLDEDLIVEAPMDLITLRDPVMEEVPAEQVWGDFLNLLQRAVQYSIWSGERFTVETGGWGSGTGGVPRCDFAVLAQNFEPAMLIEAEPAPVGTQAWEHVLVPGQPTALIVTPAVEAMLEIAPKIMFEAIGGWGLHPTSLNFTFSRHSETAEST
jgi:hypothetical protein